MDKRVGLCSRPKRLSRLRLIYRFTKSTDLRCVVVPVLRVDRQPVFSRVSAALGVRAGTMPVIVSHQAENLQVGFPCAAEGVERGCHVALVVTKLAGVLVLVVTLNDCIV